MECEYQESTLAEFHAKSARAETVWIWNLHKLHRNEASQPPMRIKLIISTVNKNKDLDNEFKFSANLGLTEGLSRYLVTKSLKCPLLKILCSNTHYGTRKIIQMLTKYLWSDSSKFEKEPIFIISVWSIKPTFLKEDKDSRKCDSKL